MLKHIFLILVLVVCYFLWEQRPVRHGPGVVAGAKPNIERIAFPEPIETESFIITPHHQVEGKVRVVANKNYWFDDLKFISSVDLLFGWDRMSDENLLKKMLVKINERAYHVQMTKPPFQRTNIHEHLLMVHAIPANEEISEKLHSIRRGQIVAFSGFLVDIEDRIGNQWSSPVNENGPVQKSSQWMWIEKLEIE